MNQILIWNDLRIFAGRPKGRIKRHSHPIIQLVLGIQGPFLSKVKGQGWVEKRGLLIAPNQFHECDATQIEILSIEIEPDSALGEWILEHQLKNRVLVDIPSVELGDIDLEVYLSKLKTNDWGAIRKLIERFFYYQITEYSMNQDPRIRKVLSFIAKNIDYKIDSMMLMKLTGLSESRLLHLFKEEMGLPIRNYILWYRLKVVFENVMNGLSLTEAAYVAGFSDQAHLSRTFVNMIGVPPSTFTKNSKFIQVSFPS